jgi:hypothetical protein
MTSPAATEVTAIGEVGWDVELLGLAEITLALPGSWAWTVAKAVIVQDNRSSPPRFMTFSLF